MKLDKGYYKQKYLKPVNKRHKKLKLHKRNVKNILKHQSNLMQIENIHQSLRRECLREQKHVFFSEKHIIFFAGSYPYLGQGIQECTK